MVIQEDNTLHGISCYLFCRHLEQNGLYDYQVVTEGENFNQNCVDYNTFKCREIHKVLCRSGVAELMDLEFENIGIVEYLVSKDIITKKANDIALADEKWRFKLQKSFGDLKIFHEGYYSVDKKYYPSYYDT